MKSSLKTIKFLFRYAFRNITFHPFRSLLLLIGYIGMILTALLAFSMEDFFHAYFYGEVYDVYREYDLEMTVSDASDTRFFSITHLDQDSVDQTFTDYISFFEVDVLLETASGEKTYVHSYSSTLAQFRKMSNLKNITQQTLNDDEIIITQSLADSLNVTTGDTIQLFAGSLSQTYTIVDIVVDGKQFRDASVYLDKTSSLSFFLTSINPAFSELPPSLLTNIYNTVYFNTHDDKSPNDAINVLKSISTYEDLNIQETIDDNAINQFVNRNVSSFSMILSMVMIAIVLVLWTTLLIYFEDKRKSFSIIEILGGTKRFNYALLIIEMFVFAVLSITLGILLTNAIISIGISYVHSPIQYHLSPVYIMLVIGLFILMFVTVLLLFIRQLNKQSSVGKIKERFLSLNPILMLILALTSLMIYIVFNTSNTQTFFGFYPPLIQLLVLFVFLFSASFFLLALLAHMLQTYQIKNVFVYHLKMMLSKKSFIQYLSVMLVSFLSIFMLILANDYMHVRYESYRNTYQIDLIVTNIFLEFDQTYQDISSLDTVDHAEKVGLYQEIYMPELNQNMNDLVSIHPDYIDTYFNIEMDISVKESLLNTDELIILLPIRYAYLYHLEKGDTIEIDLGAAEVITFKIGGFFEKQLGNLAFTNMTYVSNNPYPSNAILVNAATDKATLESQLLDAYSRDLIVVVDYQLLIDTLSEQMLRVTSYITYIISIIILCFILSIMNHSSLLLGEMRDNYARLFVLGISKKKMTRMLLLESFIVFGILLIISTFTFYLMSLRLRYLILLFGDYEPISFYTHSMWLGMLLVLLLYGFTKWFYIKQALKTNITTTLRTY